MFAAMKFDISRLLDSWEYRPGQVLVRRLKPKGGREKIQLRLDLGVLQMDAEGRPDGKRPLATSPSSTTLSASWRSTARRTRAATRSSS